MNYKLYTLTLALLLAACDQQQEPPVSAVPQQELTVAVDCDDGNLEVMPTRSGADAQNTQFASGQLLDVFISEAGTKTGAGSTYTTTYTQPVRAKTTNANGAVSFVSSSDNSTANRQYWPSSGNGVNIYAWYPTLGATALTAQPEFTVQTNQASTIATSDLMLGMPRKANGTSDNPVARYAYAASPAAVPLTFHHLLSKIVVVLQAGTGFTAAQLQNATVTIGTVKTKVKVTSLTTGATTTQTTPTGTVTLLDGTSTSRTGYCIIPPQSIAGQKVRVTLSNGAAYTYTFPTGHATEARKRYTYTLTVTPTAITVTATITDWGDGGTQNEAKGMHEWFKMDLQTDINAWGDGGSQDESSGYKFVEVTEQGSITNWSDGGSMEDSSGYKYQEDNNSGTINDWSSGGEVDATNTNLR